MIVVIKGRSFIVRDPLYVCVCIIILTFLITVCEKSSPWKLGSVFYTRDEVSRFC